MPYIDAKITGSVTPEKRELLKTELGKAISLLDKLGYVVCGSQNWRPGRGGTLKAISIGTGYWVQAKEKGATWTVTGKGDPSVEIRLNAGWTMIGYPLPAEKSVEEALATAIADGKVERIVKGSENWRAGRGGTLTTFKPGLGYWVYSSSACTITFDAE